MNDYAINSLTNRVIVVEGKTSDLEAKEAARDEQVRLLAESVNQLRNAVYIAAGTVAASSIGYMFFGG